MKEIMISGHFDPVHDGHLDYIKQAINYAHQVLCVVSSDEQVRMKKGKVNIPDKARAEILDLLFDGLHVRHRIIINRWDTDNSSLVKTLEYWQPYMLFRGGDKTIADMPSSEREVCDRLGIKIVHARMNIERHGSDFKDS